MVAPNADGDTFYPGHSSMPVDEAHEQATMFYGCRWLRDSGLSLDRLRLGGNDDHRTTFAEYWPAVNRFVNQADQSLARGCMYNGLDWTGRDPEIFQLL